eukprot:CAMPEP_0184326480 /NCGR_PEP_ID=MMETSP1049-20130417/142588_1 /TAXON_ID=77928 /ORGANISM="Proteomonas sulcata, Strain CCMP704" /LENGTH=425 /DNA_ID=CAMNT_0026648681 /DNA_START=142 /DNA_END=1419 /DNA_ORIENTATION=+
MAMESFKQSDWQNQFQTISNFFFTYIFGMECIIKMYALYPRRYYTNNWNRFDYFIVMTSFGGIAVDNLGTAIGINPTVIRILRIFRIFRILRAFRIFKALKGLQAIVTTLVNSLPAIMNLFSMLGLLFFIYGVLGVMMYGELCSDDDLNLSGLKAVRCLFTEEDMVMSRHANFKSLGFALLTLFRIATGDDWGTVMDVTELQPGKREVTSDNWNDFTLQLGYDPSLLPTSDPRHFRNDTKTVAMDMAKVIVRKWNESTYGMEEDAHWPFPNAKPEAKEWLIIGRTILPGCLLDEELLEFEDAGLVDCSVGSYTKTCVSTCGENIFSNFYFVTFVCIAAFVLLQLVIAVLMDQLGHSDENNEVELMPGTEFLGKRCFHRIYRRWRWHAAMKLRCERASKKSHNFQSVRSTGANGAYGSPHTRTNAA